MNTLSKPAGTSFPPKKPSKQRNTSRRGACNQEERSNVACKEDSSAIYETDDFKIWCMKVIPCTKRFVHDWTVCPFAHTGEKAARRDPRKFRYTGIACPDMKGSGECVRGDACPYAHNVFEYWLHPTRYRTQLCKDGPCCRRSICFFAHDLDQLRVPEEKPYISPEQLASSSLMGIRNSMQKIRTSTSSDTTPERSTTQKRDSFDRGSLDDANLVWTPHSIYSPGDVTPRGPGPVRSSAPSQSLERMPISSLGGSGVPRHSADGRYSSQSRTYMSDLYSPTEIRQHEGHPHDIGLAEALAALSMNLQRSSEGTDEYNRDTVLQTVHQVLQHALETRESSLVAPQQGDLGYDDPESQRNSSDIDTPKFSNSFPTHIDPWKSAASGLRGTSHPVDEMGTPDAAASPSMYHTHC